MRSLIAALGLILASAAYAHRPSDGYLALDIKGSKISGQVDVAIKDLEVVIGIDANGNGEVTWGELKNKRQAIEQYVAERLVIAGPTKPCSLVPVDLQVSSYSDGAYASLIFNTNCSDEALTSLDVSYNLVFDVDAQHRGLLNLRYLDAVVPHAFSREQKTFRFDPGDLHWSRQLKTFIVEGMMHIFLGYDHMLFLVALLLPAVYLRFGERKTLMPREQLSSVLIETAKVVTAFTIAHTISLCLTTFTVFTAPPARIVEALVALTILLTALNNVFPVVAERRWVVGFVFGLVHGIGYASVLTDLGLVGWSLATPLVGFNIGVEAAQLIIIALFLPVQFSLRKTAFYRWAFLWSGSIATALLALGWMVEQLSNRRFMPF